MIGTSSDIFSVSDKYSTSRIDIISYSTSTCNILLQLSSNNTSWDIANLTKSVARTSLSGINYFKLYHKGHNYILDWSKDGINWETLIQCVSDLNVYQDDLHSISFINSRDNISSSYNQYVNANTRVFANDTYIVSDDKPLWAMSENVEYPRKDYSIGKSIIGSVSCDETQNNLI